MKLKRYFLFDVETGGLDEKAHTLLSLYGLVLDHKLNILDSIDLKIKPDDGVYHLDIEALKVNKIDISEHDKVALKETEASKKLRDFLFLKCPTTEKLTPAGHGISLDVRFAIEFCPDFRTLCERRWLDTAAIGQFLQVLGKIPTTLNSLGELCSHYGIDTSKSHDAKGDVEMEHLLLKAMAKDCGWIP